MALLLMLLEDAFFAAIPALGFAMLFNVPRRLLIYCALGGAMTYSLRAVLIQLGIHIEWATLVASTTLGFLCVYCARWLLVPRPAITIPSIIPMMPGTYAFTTVIGLVELHAGGYTPELIQLVIENGLRTLFILVALSFGLAIPSVLVYRNRPIV